MTDNHSSDNISPDNPASDDADTSEQRAPSSALSDSPEKKGRTFASNAPWAGSERQWKREKTTGEIKRPENLSEPPTDSVSAQRSSVPDTRTLKQKTISVRPDSYPPNYDMEAMNRSSLPAIAAQSDAKKHLSSETKLGIAATILATVIVIALLIWYFLDVRSESVQTKEMQTVQQMMIERLQSRIQEMDDKELSTDEGQAIRKKVRALAAQLMAARNRTGEAEVAAVSPDVGADVESPMENWRRTDTKTSKGDSENTDELSSIEESNGEESATTQEKETEQTDEIPASPYELGPIASDLKQKKEKDQLDSLLGSSTPEGSAPQDSQVQKTVAKGPTTPMVPTREQVRVAMSAVGPTVKKCGDGTGGKIKMEMSISGKTGRVLSARPISAEYAGTSKGICATRAVSLAKFPKFQQRMLVIKYPFEL